MQTNIYIRNKHFALLTISIILIIVSNSISYSQNIPNKKQSFKIINEGNVLDIDIYCKSIEKANLDPYRLISERRMMQFDTGFTIELYSGNELFETYGKKIDYNTIQQKGTEIEYPNIFTISSNGHIVEKMEVISNKSDEFEIKSNKWWRD